MKPFGSEVFYVGGFFLQFKFLKIDTEMIRLSILARASVVHIF